MSQNFKSKRLWEWWQKLSHFAHDSCSALFLFWLFFVKSAHHVHLQAEGRIKCFIALTTQVFVSHFHIFLSHESAKTSFWFHLLTIFSTSVVVALCTFIHLSYPYFNGNFFSHCSQFQDFFTFSGPAFYVGWHVTYLHFRKDICHICSFSAGF